MHLFTLALIGAVLAIPHACGNGRDGPRPEPAKWPQVRPSGKWKVEFANRVSQACEFKGEGEVSVAEPPRKAAGKLERNPAGVVVVAYEDDRLER